MVSCFRKYCEGDEDIRGCFRKMEGCFQEGFEAGQGVEGREFGRRRSFIFILEGGPSLDNTESDVKNDSQYVYLQLIN